MNPGGDAGANSLADVTLVGCGHMGGALLQGWLKAAISLSYLVLKPRDLPEIFKNKKTVIHLQEPDERLKASRIIVLAVKPQIMDDVCVALAPFISSDATIISVAAGRSISSFEKIFGKNQPVVRSIPNVASAIGKGMTLAVANRHVSSLHKKLTAGLFECVGLLEWLGDENLMNAASVVSGASPAFLFYWVEALAQAGENNGVPHNIARNAARQAVIGASALLEARPDEKPGALRQSVTSPKGITEAALKILMNGKMQGLFDKAVAAAAKRGAELGE